MGISRVATGNAITCMMDIMYDRLWSIVMCRSQNDVLCLGMVDCSSSRQGRDCLAQTAPGILALAQPEDLNVAFLAKVLTTSSLHSDVSSS